ncbi:MAG: hypothetical protein H5T86_07275, partial [Armatimonadetes bacterium]|nr:hypothetical protein [Armatimonadota bacterium]
MKCVCLISWLLTLQPWPPAKFAEPWDVGMDIAWRNIGPGGGGWIQSIAADPLRPNVLHVGCDVGGYYYSEDGGRTFEIRNRGLVDYYVDAIAVHPRNPAVIILGTRSGIHKTTDGGRSWRWIRAGFPEVKRYSYSAPIAAVCFDPANPDVVYAGVGQPREGKSGLGAIYKSDDCGETWRLAAQGLPADAIVSDIEVRPDNPREVLAATNRGVFLSEDGGATWRLSSDGMSNRDVYRLAIAPSDPRVVYCTVRTHARDDEPWDGGVYRSEDGGRSWRACNNGLPARVAKSGQAAPMGSQYQEIVVDPRDANVAYVGSDAWVSPGVFKTTNGGGQWSWCSRHVDSPSGPRNMDYGWLTFWGPSVECLT